MNARNRIFGLLGVLFVLSLCWYFFSTNRSADLQLIGTVDANEVIVSSRIPGRIETLTVDEGDDVQAGQLMPSSKVRTLRRRATPHRPAPAPRDIPCSRPATPSVRSAAAPQARLLTPKRSYARRRQL